LSLTKVLDKGLLSEISRVKPDELAPSLGAVVLAIAEGRTYEEGWSFYKPSLFFSLTHPTSNFINILKTIIDNLSSKGVAAIFLNLDMGSGKTHLLTLLLHLFASCNLSPQQCSEYVGEYRTKAGYGEGLANKTVVVAFDLRTPKLAYRYLKLTEKLLSKIGAYNAADIVRKGCESNKMPDPKELAEKIPEDVNLLILIDELHYAATIGDEEDRRVVADVIRFVLGLMNYRRTLHGRTSGVFAVAASARKDFNRWQEVRDSINDRGFVSLIDSFIDQMHRVESTPETRWLNLDEAQRILEKRLGLKQNTFGKVFHRSFDKVIERIIRADSDVPQAQHLRSLIKAIAVYTLEALKAGDDVVTPARFNESIIDILLAGSEIAVSYRSIYSEIVNKLSGSMSGDKALLAINSIFSLTITGAPEKLIEMVRVAKTREVVPQHVPLISEVELRDVLKTYKIPESEINNVIKGLDEVHPNIHRVSIAGGGYAYFVAPVASVITIYRKMIDDKYKWYLGNPNVLVNRVCEHLQNLVYGNDYSNQKVIENLQELEKTPLSKDKFYIYVYVNKNLLAQLSADLETNNDSFNAMKTDATRFLEKKKEHNIVFVLPRINKGVLGGIARYLAIDESTEYVINHYIAPLEKPRERREEDVVLQKLLEIELGDLKAEVGRKINEALLYFTTSMRSAFAEALYFTPKGVMWEPITIEPKGEKEVYVRDIRGAIDILRKHSSDIIADAGRALNERVRQGYIVLATPHDVNVTEIISRDVIDALKSQQTITLHVDEPKLERLAGDKDRWVYIPPSVMRAVIGNVVGRVKKEFEDTYEVKVKVEDEKYIISIESKSVPSIPSIPSIQPTPPPEPPKDVMELIDYAGRIGGVVWVAISVDKNTADQIKRAVSLIRKYIQESRLERKT
jgi:hypothetical protein